MKWRLVKRRTTGRKPLERHFVAFIGRLFLQLLFLQPRIIGRPLYTRRHFGISNFYFFHRLKIHQALTPKSRLAKKNEAKLYSLNSLYFFPTSRIFSIQLHVHIHTYIQLLDKIKEIYIRRIEIKLLRLSPSALTFHSLLFTFSLPSHATHTHTRARIARTLPPRGEFSPPRSGIKSPGIQNTAFPGVKICSPVGSCPRNSKLGYSGGEAPRAVVHLCARVCSVHAPSSGVSGE